MARSFSHLIGPCVIGDERMWIYLAFVGGDWWGFHKNSAGLPRPTRAVAPAANGRASALVGYATCDAFLRLVGGQLEAVIQISRQTENLRTQPPATPRELRWRKKRAGDQETEHECRSATLCP